MIEPVSVIIPTYNYGRFIGAALDGVLGQTLRPAEVIVVDDGSTDDTEAVVRAFIDAAANDADGVRIEYIKQANAGVCAARNRGVAASSGKYIAFADADDIWHPTKLENQIAKFGEDEKIGLVHCGMREFDSDTGETIAVNIDGMEGDVADELLLWERSVIVGPGGTIVVTRNAFDDAGGFDTKMKVGEDWDFCYRVARKYRVGFVREALIDYRSHSSAAHRNVAEMERGMARFYEKAFADGGPDVQKLKRRSYGNFYRVVSGSYFQAGEIGNFLRTAAKSIWYRPAGIAYFAAFPFRRFARRK
jgi:glycosyltransferase involved in cell wall biosynthesis